MSYSSSSPYYTRAHGGAYGKPAASSGGVGGGAASGSGAGGGTERPATLNLGKTSTSGSSGTKSQHVQQHRYEETTSKTSSSSSTSTSALFPTMGSSMIFHPKPSRYANPTVPPAKSSSQSHVPGTATSSYSASRLAASTTTNLLAAASSSTKLQYLSGRTGQHEPSSTQTQQYQHQQEQEHSQYSQGKAPVQLSSISKPFSSTAGCNIPQPYQPISTLAPKSSISNLGVGYGRTTIPYYQSKLSTSNQNLAAGEPTTAGTSPQTYGHAVQITMNPLCKSAGSSNLSNLGVMSTSVYGSSGGGSTQNLSTLGNMPAIATGASGTGLGLQSSKSSNYLTIDSIPNVFCLSCPPAEFKFSDAYRAKTLPRSGKENERLIGFATLPEQVHRKSVKKGFDFTLMAVGESGLGKSTLINSLFLADFYQNRKIPNVHELVKRTTTIQKHTIEIEERGVKLRLTVVDTPGFGDAINCEESWKTCVEYIDEQFHQYFQAESGLNRRHIQDTRVHCCLYFVPPYGRGLRELDLEVMRNLQNRVNVIPIIAKADTLTQFEVKRMKDQIMQDLKSNMISIYQFPECDEDEDEEFKKQDRELKAAIPFAVASSLTFVDGKRARQYPWGTVEIENPSHSDFGKLRTMLIQSHMHDLKETTQDLHYENFRAKAIAQISQGRTGRERTKLKRDSSMDSPQELLMQKEAEIKKMQQMISKMEAKLKAQSYKPPPPPSRDSVIDI